MDEILLKIATAESANMLWVHVRDFLRRNGVNRISYHHQAGALSGPAQAENVTIIAQGFPQKWLCDYVDEELFTIDPITETDRSAPGPFAWDQIDQIMRLTPAQTDYLSRMRAAGVSNGLAFQVYGPAMRNAYVGLGFAGDLPTLGSKDLLQMQCIAQAGHLRFCELTRDQSQAVPMLSEREREVLHWIARGKSNGVISTILGVSPHTVDTMVRRLYAKLDVSDRTTAAIRGVGAGLVLPVA